MVSREDLAFLEAEKNQGRYKEERFPILATLFMNPRYQDCTLPTPEKVKRIYGSPVLWVDSPEKDRASVGIIYVQTLDGKAAFKAPWEAKGGITDWYHFREILRFSVDAVGAAKNLRRGNQQERPLLLSFYDPDLIQYRIQHLNKERHPLGVIVTGSGKIDNGLDHLLFSHEGKSVIFTSQEGAQSLESLVRETKGISVEIIGSHPRNLDMKSMLKILKQKYGVERFLVLGGPGFSTDLILQGCVDNYYINIAATLSGNQSIRSFFDTPTSLPHLTELELVSLKMMKHPQGEGACTLFPHYTPKREM